MLDDNSTTAERWDAAARDASISAKLATLNVLQRPADFEQRRRSVARDAHMRRRRSGSDAGLPGTASWYGRTGYQDDKNHTIAYDFFLSQGLDCSLDTIIVNKFLRIKNWRLGYLNRTLQLLILMYAVVAIYGGLFEQFEPRAYGWEIFTPHLDLSESRFILTSSLYGLFI